LDTLRFRAPSLAEFRVNVYYSSQARCKTLIERRNSLISPNSRALQAYYVTVVEDRPILSAEYRLPLLAQTDPPCSAVSLR